MTNRGSFRFQLACMWVVGCGLALATREHILYALGNILMGCAIGSWAMLGKKRP